MSDEAAPPPSQDRRSFLATLGGAAIAATGLGAIACAMNPSTSGAAAGATAASPAVAGGTPLGPIGVQLYTVRDEMQKDVAATLARVAKIGYKEVEFAGYFDHSPTEIRGMLDANGLTAPSSHIPLQMMQADAAKVGETAKIIGHEYVVVPYLEPNMRNDWHGLAKTLNQIGGEMSKQGLKLGYHNHNFEFAPNGSEPLPYEILVNETDPALVKLEMDLYWATMAGQDPLTWFAKQPGRFELVHVKDSKGAPDNAMAPVGSGTIDWHRLFAKRSQAGIRHFFVEHDNAADFPGGSFASIASSFNYLNAFRG